MTKVLPPPEPPTHHPGFSEGRHTDINVFQLMPVRKVGSVGIGDTIDINIATYVDPFAEMDYHRLVASYPRWVQGLRLLIEALEPVYESPPIRSRYFRPDNLSADKVFAGSIVNHDENNPVTGVMHPEFPGWLAFEGNAFANRNLQTIADFKAAVGKIDREEAVWQRERCHRQGTFLISNTVMT